ncbi:hypothetical protein J6590_004619 [Homalodisca vitripennis]|nr:hypothetical protein J6590_004619 [Homalodisca vitripennis]
MLRPHSDKHKLASVDLKYVVIMNQAICRQTMTGQSVDNRTSVGRQSHVSQSTVARPHHHTPQSVDVARQSVDGHAQSVDNALSRSTVARQSAQSRDSRSTVARQSVDGHARRSTIARQSVDSRTSVSRQSHVNRSTVTRQSVDNRPSVDLNVEDTPDCHNDAVSSLPMSAVKLCHGVTR